MKAAEGVSRAFVLRTLVQGAVAVVAVGLGVGVANAVTAGRSGSHARSALSVAGTINGPGMGAEVMASYVFLKGTTTACTVPTVLRRDTATGHFTAEVDVERCPVTLFDGSDVTVRVDVGGTTGVATGAVNPVPYAHFASVAGHLAEPDCPFGYTSDPVASVRERMICQKRLRDGVFDEVVRVGYGAASFWIDRYEASVWNDSTATSRLVTDAATGRIGIVAANGEWTREDRPTTSPHNSWSVRGEIPSYNISWFQARELCRMSGKRLPTHEEWETAARGTPDPDEVSGDGREGRCNTRTGGVARSGDREPREGRIGCQSAWGVQDMIGNLSEWTAEWHVAVGRAAFEARPGSIAGNETNRGMPAWPDDRTLAGWPASEEFGGDSLYNIASGANPGDGPIRFGVPSATLRGGSYNVGAQAGLFSLNLNAMPSFINTSVGFRCVIPR